MRPAAILIAAFSLLAFTLPMQAQQPAPAAPAQQPAQQSAPAAQPSRPAAPPKPYKAVAVQLPSPSSDASFIAFRKQLGEIAKRKDRAALEKLVVTQKFFWQSADGDNADKAKSSFENFATAIGLDAKEGYGWDLLAAAAEEPTLESVPGLTGVSCAPAGPTFDENAFDEIVKATGTEEGEWVVTALAKTELHSGPKADTPVTETVGTILIRLLPEDQQTPPAQAADIPFIKVVAPSGKVGYVSAEALLPLDFEQICYLKDAAAWKITGFFGGTPQ